MNPLLPSTCLLLAIAGTLCAEVPRKPGVTKYRSLWTDSPFTTKPVTSGPIQYNPLQDYVLMGVSPIEQGYRVTLLNTKNPKDGRIIVESHQPNDGIQIMEVIHKKGKPKETQVRLSRSGNVGLVGFEEKYLAIKAPPSPSPQQRANPRAQTSRNTNTNQQQRVPRRRIVPPVPQPPNPKANQGTNSSNQNRGNNQSQGGRFPGLPNPTR